MSKKITMQQIADRLGISKFTVSQALSGKSGVSQENRKRIQEAARAMGYKVRSGKGSDFGKPDAFAADEQDSSAETEPVIPYILVWIDSRHFQETGFWGKVLAGIMATCKEHGYEHIIVPLPVSEQQHLKIPRYLERSACIGHILVGTFPSQAVISLKQSGLPFVLVDHEEPLVEADCVLNNNLDSGKLACKRLLSAGCKRIVFIGDDSYAISFKERWWGARLAMEDVAGPAHELVLKKWSIAYSTEFAASSLERKLVASEATSLPDGFICANDHIALELIALLKMKGVSVPGQTKVIGFDNIEMSAYADPALSTIELGKESLGIRAVEMLLYRIQHPGRLAEKIVLSSQFIIRDSG
ncbi:LacI family DNA-binding transcriptional regulator [Paenibacillus athensensis]|uniref:Sugar-binding protein n=1 Tax=Paenibacillus athensensis TaxID=1967502 RepID=A0A4Y8Q1U6_9BACL|nr:LacI family DNA-binding transcriptional regulator [Paenibacillus athensensis]MCD1261002.1 LacI family DNA-binding transcriptional regulator [Paenibacillus athensensis]